MEQSEHLTDETNTLTWPGGSCTGQGRARRQSDGAQYQSKKPQFFMGDLALAEVLNDKESMEKKVVVGICAMAKKSNSKPMKEIIKRLENFTRLQVLIFDEDVILNHSVEDWPVVNAFISFFSSGFPLDKAIAYKNLRHPFVVNDLEMQKILQDRTEVYRILEEHKIPHPRYAVLNKNKDTNCKVVETEDSIEINGKLHVKPFVEKPIDAEDHNVYIYFPQSAGGGSTRLFRKGLRRLEGELAVKDRSSVYSHISRVRRNGDYLYEDFMPTDGTDVKVYTVGTDYQHAEARKSPCLDGKVERDQDGKEIRYPVLLSAREKLIARKVVWAFGQNVCGFDLLRANGTCYVCDVNGFSFVKTSSKYYDDCARILGTLMLREVCPTLHIPFPVGPAPEDIPVVPTTSGHMMELRCVVALIRHGDRTPKQKMKMEVKHKMFFELFEKYGGFKNGQLKLKRPKQLQEVLDIVRQLLNTNSLSSDPNLLDKKAKLQQMKLVLEMYEFTGIHRKVQFKYQPQGRPHGSSSEEEVGSPQGSAQGFEPQTPCPAEAQAGSGQLDDAPRDPSLLLILKWGGELTPAGRIQAENLGKAFRTLYPGGQGQFEAPGLGFLRLHSTFRHDLKIYASDEGRVQMTAAAFTKGLLALEGELTPILVQMVKSANTNGLLDGEGKTSKGQIVVKEKLKSVFNQNHDFTEEDNYKLNATNTLALTNAMDFVKNPQEMCKRVHSMIKEITTKIRSLKAELKARDLHLYNGESWELLIRRWAKLEKDFQLKSGQFEISKIPDIYDCIKYDLQHNQKTLQYERAQELFMCSKALADIIIPQEYGTTSEEKLHIAQNYCSPFLRKIRSDFLQVANPNLEDSTTRLDSRIIGLPTPPLSDLTERATRRKARVVAADSDHPLSEYLELLPSGRRYRCIKCRRVKYSKGVSSPERFVRTRLYFTSESHIHSMLNMLRYGNLFESGADSQWERALSFLDATAELNYMSQIVFMLFEDPSKEINSDERYHMELHFSPGAYTSCDEPTEPRGMGYRPKHCQQKSESPNREKTPQTLASAFLGPLPKQSGAKRALRLDNISASDLGDISESDIFDHGNTPETSPESGGSYKATGKASPDKLDIVEKADSLVKSTKKCPGSPDPNIPDWDWGDDNTVPAKCEMEEKGKGKSLPDKLDGLAGQPELENRLTQSDSGVLNNSARMVSMPINITVSGASSSGEQLSKPNLDEKRSRSLEDKNDSVAENSTYHRNYKTVHLPLHNDLLFRRSLPCVFSLGFNVTGGAKALEGFSYVPQLHPLETLHNALTYREIDDFLGRITTTRFPMPSISPSLAASRPSLMFVSPGKYPISYTPSSNSSSGPSSPASVATPIDLLSNLRMYIERSNESQRSDPDTDSFSGNRRDSQPASSVTVEASTVGLKPSSSQNPEADAEDKTMEASMNVDPHVQDSTDTLIGFASSSFGSINLPGEDSQCNILQACVSDQQVSAKLVRTSSNRFAVSRISDDAPPLSPSRSRSKESAESEIS